MLEQETSPAESWLELRTTAPPESAEWCAQILLDAGCLGAQIDDTEILFDESEDAIMRPRELAIITAYWPLTREYSGESLETLLRENGFDAPLETDPIAPQDWANNWRQNFPPLSIPPFRIVATWHDDEEKSAAPNTCAPNAAAPNAAAPNAAAPNAAAPNAAAPNAAAPNANANSPENETVELRLDPGLAFGTGQHPTTFLCLQLLAAQVREYSQQSESAPRVLDVGCGSGILSIAAAKLGARVWASDLDPFCTRAALENAEVNSVELEEVREIAGTDWALEAQPHGFDMVVANLMSALLVQLAPQLFAAVRSGGTLIVSGISAPRADDVESALHAAGFSTLRKLERDGETRGDFLERWTAFVLRK